MDPFRFDLVSPAKLLFTDEVDQVDLPGVEGDFGVLAGHVPIVALLRPGIIAVRSAGNIEKFVLMGGFAEFSGLALTVLADAASSVDEFDAASLKATIDEVQESLGRMSAGPELDRAIKLLDDYKSLHVALSPATAF
ncbi:MAG TPA: F0F1 ATP synthase subunit epsilon [Bradyrhizobium sp.]|nr:F0F1 ATP synthase subunit epsilon [Bradyrhizobium sp.]